MRLISWTWAMILASFQAQSISPLAHWSAKALM